MSPESQPIRIPEVGNETFGIIIGFFAGKEDEIDQEIKEVESWPTSVRLGAQVIRKDQELKHLNKRKAELENIKNFILKTLGYQPNQTQFQSENQSSHHRLGY